MSERERAMLLLNKLPDQKLMYVIAYMQGLSADIVETVRPDEWDMRMIAEAERENTDETVTIDELEAILGVAL